MKKAFLDSDVILDSLLERAGFYLPATNILTLAYQNKLDLVTSAVVFVNVHYFLDKYDKSRKLLLLKELRSIVSILNVNEATIDMALKSGLDDFEDAVQYYVSVSAKCDVIITRNIKDYKQSTIPVLTPEQFLRQL